MAELTFKDVENKVREMAKERPGFIYREGEEIPLCYNNPDENQPGCLFGQAFIALGHPVPAHANGWGIVTTLDVMDVAAKEEQRRWAVLVQNGQDDQKPWGEAVRLADEAYPEIRTA